ncbi:MAG TPA: DNA alkylation repair protein [Coriobacteriia bacterium]|nr:DNA alkylation repair protein [Coriobacteriia bacterium]
MPLDLDSVMRELESLGTAHTRKSYLSRGVREPLFGVATGAMKPLKKEIGIDQAMANALWETGNYDAMYLAGMVADVSVMTEADFERWIDDSYGPMLSDHVVSVTLAESELAQVVAGRWIRSEDETRAAAGWACYEWLLGWRPDSYFDVETIQALLELMAATIHDAAPRVKRNMNSCLVAIGVSYLPLHNAALSTADAIGHVEVVVDGVAKTLKSASEQIRAAEAKGRLGFKRRAVRC